MYIFWALIFDRDNDESVETFSSVLMCLRLLHNAFILRFSLEYCVVQYSLECLRKTRAGAL